MRISINDLNDLVSIIESLSDNEINLLNRLMLNELSDETIGNYLRKASKDKARMAFHKGFMDGGSPNIHPSARGHALRNMDTTTVKRNRGIDMALGKLKRKEGVKDYVRSASDDMSSAAYNQGKGLAVRRTPSLNDTRLIDAARRVNKRDRGIDMALRRNYGMIRNRRNSGNVFDKIKRMVNIVRDRK